MVKNLPAKEGDAGQVGSIPGLERSPGEGNGKPTAEFLPRESHGQRSLLQSMGLQRVEQDLVTENTYSP